MTHFLKLQLITILYLWYLSYHAVQGHKLKHHKKHAHGGHTAGKDFTFKRRNFRFHKLLFIALPK